MPANTFYHTPEEWDDHRGVIEQLYLTQNKTLNKVREILRTEYDFAVTSVPTFSLIHRLYPLTSSSSESQMKKQLDRWELAAKNMKLNPREKAALLQLQDGRRQQENKRTEFRRWKRLVDPRTLGRFRDGLVKRDASIASLIDNSIRLSGVSYRTPSVNGSSRAISRNNSRQTISKGSSSRSPSVNGSHRAFSRGGSHRTAAVRSSNHVPVGAQTDRRWRKANIVEIITKYIPRLNGKPTSPNVAAYPDIPDQAPDSPSPTEELFNNLINQNMLQHDSEDANTDHLTPSDVGIAEGEPPEFQLPTEFQISPSPVVNAGDNAKVWDFLYQGADPESAELGLAILHGQEQVVQTLLVLGTDPDGRNQAKQTPLHLAVKEGRIAIVEILLQHGADVNAFDCCQWTSLHIAVRWGVCTQILQSLLEHGADVNARNEDSNTPLHFAANWGAVGAMQMLLEHGANANAENRFCLTPLEGAISSARDMAIVAILLKHGADTDLRSKDGNTVLHTAIFLGVNGIVGLLLANEVEITAHNRHGHTPLEVAVSYGNTEAVELLIGHDRNAAVQVIRQGKLLREALKYRRLPIAKLLLQNGASVNEVDENLETGLHWASRTGNIEAADFLLRNRADINARNLSRRTPIQIARDNGHDPLVGWLLLKGAKDISTDRAARGVMSAGTQTPLPALPGEPDMWDWPPSDPGNNYLLKLVKELTGDWSL